MNVEKSVFILVMAFNSLTIRGQAVVYDKTLFEKYGREIIEILCSDSLQGRKAGTNGDIKSQQYLTNFLQKHKIKPFYETTYLQPFSYINQNKDTIYTANIIFWINNRATKYMLFTAHYDHLGYGGQKSRSYFKQAIHPGANDNASGVALVLLLSKYLNSNHQRQFWNKKLNYIFVLFSGHEDGLYGSSYFIESLPLHIVSNIVCAINIDMIGNFNLHHGLVLYDPNSIIDTSFLKKTTFPITHKPDTLLINDHSSFVKKNVSGLTITTGYFDDYHKISDTPDKINYEGMFTVFKFLYESILLNYTTVFSQ